MPSCLIVSPSGQGPFELVPAERAAVCREEGLGPGLEKPFPAPQKGRDVRRERREHGPRADERHIEAVVPDERFPGIEDDRERARRVPRRVNDPARDAEAGEIEGLVDQDRGRPGS